MDYLEGSMCFAEHNNTFGDRCDYSFHSDQDCCLKRIWPEVLEGALPIEPNAIDLFLDRFRFPDTIDDSPEN